MSPTGDLLVTFIFVGGNVLLSLLRGFQVLHWHGTEPGAAHPSGYLRAVLSLQVHAQWHSDYDKGMSLISCASYRVCIILAKGAIALSVTLSGGALLAS